MHASNHSFLNQFIFSSVIIFEVLVRNRHGTCDLRILETSSTFQRLMNRAAGDLLGKSLHEVLPSLEPLIVKFFPGLETAGSKSFPHMRPEEIQRDFAVLILRLGHTRGAAILLDITGQLEIEKDLRARLEQEFSMRRDELKRRVEERTVQLVETTNQLEENQKELLLHKRDLEQANRELVQTNTALSVLARNINKKRDELEKKIALSVSSQIIPLIEELRQDKIGARNRAKLDIVAALLKDLTPGASKISDVIVALSPMELRVAMMIKNGFATDEIARIFNTSPHTVKTHRRSIRRKLNIRNSKINLTSFLKFKLGKSDHSH